MKLTKFLAVFMAGAMALGLASCKKSEGGNDEPAGGSFTVTPATVDSMTVGQTVTLTASSDATTWSVASSTNSISLDKTAGKTVVVTALAAGKGSIVASCNGEQKIIAIVVKGQGGGGSDVKLTGYSEVYPIFLDQEVWDANADIMKSDFRVDEETKHLYIWASGETYNAGEGSGKSYYGLTNGYVSLTVAAPDGWSGGGVNLDATYATQVNELIAKIKAEPDKYYLHIGIKSTDNTVHKLYLFGDAQYHIVLGASAFVDNGVSAAPFCDFTRNGAWQGIDFPMSKYADKLVNVDGAKDIFSFLSGAAIGGQLNLDAVFFYKKK